MIRSIHRYGTSSHRIHTRRAFLFTPHVVVGIMSTPPVRVASCGKPREAYIGTHYLSRHGRGHWPQHSTLDTATVAGSASSQSSSSLRVTSSKPTSPVGRIKPTSSQQQVRHVHLPHRSPVSLEGQGKLPRSIMVANRGEIACRVFQTCRKLGIKTVAVYTAQDLSSQHIKQADIAVKLQGPKGYMDQLELIRIMKEHEVEAVFPGYGFLSESPSFALACEEANIVFVGPKAANMEQFSLKHTARATTKRAGVPIVPGTEVMRDVNEAVNAVHGLGYPVMIKAVAGGGGIGMHLCKSEEELRENFETATRQGQTSFGNAEVYLEKVVRKPRHIEVQVLGDGKGNAVAFGERDCSVQRRHQKVLEEAPAPSLPNHVRAELHRAAVTLLETVKYNNAGTVEFLVDGVNHDFHFLEVNTRLQVEHPITEFVCGVDLVEWMLRQGSGENGYGFTDIKTLHNQVQRKGHAIEARLYCEDPSQDFTPSPGLLSEVRWPVDRTTGKLPSHIRVDTWVRTGTRVTHTFDPMIAKLIVYGDTREEALGRFEEALHDTELRGTTTNLPYLRSVVQSKLWTSGKYDTSMLYRLPPFREAQSLLIKDPGLYTTVQDYPGRTAEMGESGEAWRVGIPPSGPMDALSHRIANQLVGNEVTAAALEITNKGPTLTFTSPAFFALAGAQCDQATLDGEPVDMHTCIEARAGQVLSVGVCSKGARAYLAVHGGIDVPLCLGSRSTLVQAGLGGHQGRPLLQGDSVKVGKSVTTPPFPGTRLTDPMLVERLWSRTTIGVMVGPQASPEYLTEHGMNIFFNSSWKVSVNSNRMGVRFEGSHLDWARNDGGAGGSHPSNVIDNEYALGTINISGDMPIAVSIDGPSLGGFVCNVTAATCDVWKFGQLCPGDTVRFVPMPYDNALTKQAYIEEQLAALYPANRAFFRSPILDIPTVGDATASEAAHTPATEREFEMSDVLDTTQSVLMFRPESMPTTVTTAGPLAPGPDNTAAALRVDKPEMRILRQGDKYIMVTFGKQQQLDFNMRFQIYALEKRINEAKIPGIRETSPGICSLQIDYDNTVISLPTLMDTVVQLEKECESVLNLTIPSRVLHLPIAINDKWTNVALEMYRKSVREEAPYLPSNFEFVARNNGLSVEETEQIILQASYMVLGLGDVYLGCPCAAPVDPRHRLVNPKFNPARTFTPEGSVGIGGAFMCLYPMNSPGGYQLVGRSLPIWNTHTLNSHFEKGKPWLMRMFDQVRFYKVSDDELEDMFEPFRHGILQPTDQQNPTAGSPLRVEHTTFSVLDYNKMINEPQVLAETKVFQERQREAAAVELEKEKAYQLGRAEQDNITLTYEEKLVAAVNRKTMSKEERIQTAFQKMDLNKDGVLSKEELGQVLDRAKAHELITKADVNGDGRIEYQEFLDLIERRDAADRARKMGTQGHLQDAVSASVTTAPLTANVWKIQVRVGQKVSAGDSIVVLEAMKMEHQVKAQEDGVIASIAISEGDTVDQGTPLFKLSRA